MGDSFLVVLIFLFACLLFFSPRRLLCGRLFSLQLLLMSASHRLTTQMLIVVIVFFTNVTFEIQILMVLCTKCFHQA